MALNIFLPPSENQPASFQFLLRVGRWVFPPSTCLGSSRPETLFSYQGQGQVGGSPLEWTLQCCLLQRKTNQEDCNVSTYQKEDKPHQKNYHVIINSSWAVSLWFRRKTVHLSQVWKTPPLTTFSQLTGNTHPKNFTDSTLQPPKYLWEKCINPPENFHYKSA